MPDQPVPAVISASEKVLRIAVISDLYAQLVVNVFHYSVVDAVITPGELAFYGTTVWNYIKATWMACLSPAFVVQRLQVAVEGRPEIPSEEVEISTANTGLREDPSMPPSVAMVIRLRSYLGGRRGRGRKFIAGLEQTAHTAGQLNATLLGTTFSAFAEKLDDVIPFGDTGQLLPVIYSRNKTGETGVRATQVITAVCDKILRSQRRREIGVGA